MWTRKLVALSAGAALLSLGAVSAASADWPERAVTLVVPYAPGGVTDLVARRLQPALEELLGADFTVINTEGHASVGHRRVIDARPDGYEFLVTETGIITQQASGVADFGYRELEPVAAFGNFCTVVMAHSVRGWTDFSDAVAEAQERDEPFVAGVTLGGISHMGLMALSDAAGIEVRFAQVGGTGDAYAAVLGGHSDFMWATPGDAMGYTLDAEGNPQPDAEVTALVVVGPERYAGLPDVPTASELGYDVEICLANLVFAPKETPDEIVNAMADAIEEAYHDPSVADFLAERGAGELFLQGEELNRFLDEQWDVLAPLAEAALRED